MKVYIIVAEYQDMHSSDYIIKEVHTSESYAKYRKEQMNVISEDEYVRGYIDIAYYRIVTKELDEGLT